MTDLREADQLLGNGRVIRDGKEYGCHADIFYGDEPDGCVIQTHDYGDCIYGTLKNGHARRSRWTCKYWKRLRK